MNKMFVALLATFAFIAPAFAADTSVRSACEADIKSFCASVQPGGGRIKSCIKEHKDQVSSGCKTALENQAGGRRRHGATESPPESKD